MLVRKSAVVRKMQYVQFTDSMCTEYIILDVSYVKRFNEIAKPA